MSLSPSNCLVPQWNKVSLYSQCGPVYKDILVTSQSPHSFSQCPKKANTRSLTLDIRCKSIWLCCCLIYVLSAIVKREKLTNMLSLHFPKEHRGSSFLEKTDTQLSHSSSFIKTFTRIIGEKAQLPKPSCSCYPWEQTTHTSLSVFWLWLVLITIRTPGFPGVSYVQGKCSCKFSCSTKCRILYRDLSWRFKHYWNNFLVFTY